MAEQYTKSTRLKGRRKRFLRALALTGSVTDAARKAGVSRRATYSLKTRSPEFAREWQEALDQGIDALEDEVMSRALDRNDDKSHLLLMFAVKAHRTKYRDGKNEGGAGEASAIDVIRKAMEPTTKAADGQ